MLVTPIVEMFRNARTAGTARSIVPRPNAPNSGAPPVPVSTKVVVPDAGPTTSGSTPRSCPAKTCACRSTRPGTTSLPVASITRSGSPPSTIRPSRMKTSRPPRIRRSHRTRLREIDAVDDVAAERQHRAEQHQRGRAPVPAHALAHRPGEVDVGEEQHAVDRPEDRDPGADVLGVLEVGGDEQGEEARGLHDGDHAQRSE